MDDEVEVEEVEGESDDSPTVAVTVVEAQEDTSEPDTTIVVVEAPEAPAPIEQVDLNHESRITQLEVIVASLVPAVQAAESMADMALTEVATANAAEEELALVEASLPEPEPEPVKEDVPPATKKQKFLDGWFK